MLRGWLTRRYFKRMLKHNRSMSRSVYYFYFAFVMLVKLNLIVLGLTAAVGLFIDDQVPNPDVEEYATLFQGHVHDRGIVYQIVMVGHVLSATWLLLTLPIALVAKKGQSAHIAFGRMFIFGWLVHFADGMAGATIYVSANGWIESNYYRENGFPMWNYAQFAFLGAVIGDLILHGISVLQFKIRIPKGLRVLLIISNFQSIATGIILFIVGLFNVIDYANGVQMTMEKVTFSVVFLVQCPVYIVLIALNITHWFSDDLTRRMYQWYQEHTRCMIFTANLTVVTALANVMYRFAPTGTVYAWTLKEVQAIVYAAYRRHKFSGYFKAATTMPGGGGKNKVSPARVSELVPVASAISAQESPRGKLK